MNEFIDIGQQIDPQLLAQIEAYPNQLPSTSEIAGQGVEEYGRVARALPRDLRELFLLDKEFRRCFVGTNPEIGSCAHTLLCDLSIPDLRRFKGIFTSLVKYFIVIGHPTDFWNRHLSLSIINLKAAGRIIQNYPLIFPDEALERPEQWLVENPKEWLEKRGVYLSYLRLGLLSGFPVSSALRFPYYATASDKFRYPLSKEDLIFYRDYGDTNGNRTSTMINRQRELILARSKGITKKELDALLEAEGVDTLALGGFVIFGRLADWEYVRQTDALYRESCIDQAAESLLA